MLRSFQVISSFKQTFSTGAVTGVVAGTATLGHLLALRNPASSGRVVRLRSLEIEFILTTAFGAAQQIGFDAYVARTYSAAHSAQTALDIATSGTGKKLGTMPASILTGRIAGTGALTAGTHTLDTNAIARGSAWASAIGAQLAPRYFDFTTSEPYGLFLREDEGLIVRNLIAMGATGVGTWHITPEWDEGILVA